MDGTRTVTTVSAFGEVQSRITSDIAVCGIVTASEIYTYNDNWNQSHSVSNLDTTQTSVEYGCCGLEQSVDADGTVTYHWTDPLHRQTATTRNGVTNSNVLDAAGNILTTLPLRRRASWVRWPYLRAGPRPRRGCGRASSRRCF